MRVFLSKSERKRYYRRIRIKIYLFLGLAIFTIAAIFSFLINWNFFRIDKFEIIGAAKLEEARAEVLKNGLARFLGFSNFLVWPSVIGEVRVEKDYSNNTLRLIAEAPEKFAIWCALDCYWINRGGKTIELAPDTEGSSIPKISGPLPKEELFKNIVAIIDGLAKLPIRIIGYNFDERLQELTALGTRGEKMIFGTRFAPSIKSFNYLNELVSSGQLRTAEYVDLTVENRIYLKPR